MAENISPSQKARPADDFLRLQDLWALFLPKWYWFVLSVCVALGVAVFYLVSTPPLYTRTASILIMGAELNDALIAMRAESARRKKNTGGERISGGEEKNL